jgi:hypothetical protein
LHIFCVTLSHMFEHNCGYHGMLLTQLGHHYIDFEFVDLFFFLEKFTELLHIYRKHTDLKCLRQKFQKLISIF